MRPTKATWVRPHLGAAGLHEVATERRHLGSEKRTPFTRPPRNRSWRPPGYGTGNIRASEPAPTVRRRRQGCQRWLLERARWKTTPPRRDRTQSPKWEPRRETRFSPVSFASGGPSLPVLFPRVFGRDERGAKETDVSRGRARTARSGRRRAPAGAERLLGIQGPLRWESAKYGCSSLNVSECRDRSDVPAIATPVGATKRTSDTRDLARRKPQAAQ